MNCPVHYVDNGEFDEASDEISQKLLFPPKSGASRSKFDEAHFASLYERVGRSP